MTEPRRRWRISPHIQQDITTLSHTLPYEWKLLSDRLARESDAFRDGAAGAEVATWLAAILEVTLALDRLDLEIHPEAASGQ
jgi:hypothetical protein